ncbi:MAG: hypothetical protein HGA96_08445 [Desulfobulbaceae bacterium]|nr:hypothetical protein [Desulfobulbaceae bacterium]
MDIRETPMSKIRPGIKILFMSGYTADVIAKRGVLAPDIQKARLARQGSPGLGLM